jgi:hypothetical protein
MDAKPFLEHLSDDEAISGGIADAEAKLLLNWLRTSVKKAVSGLKDEKAAWDAVAMLKERARSISKVVSALCYDDEPAEAQKHWTLLGYKQPLSAAPATDAVAAVKQLVAWEDASRA